MKKEVRVNKVKEQRNSLIVRLSRKLDKGLQECGWDILSPIGSDGSLRKLLGGIADYILKREKLLLANPPSRWLVVGGTPFRINGTVTYTSMVKFGVFSTYEEAQKCSDLHKEDCSMFIEIFEV